VLGQQFVQAPINGWLAAVGRRVVETHIVGCWSRLRLPIDMGASVVPDRTGVDLTAVCSEAAADVRHGSRAMELSASAAVIGIDEP
jgi:hypothetical protein